MATLGLHSESEGLWQARWVQRGFLVWLLFVFWGWGLLTWPVYLLLTSLPAAWQWPRKALHRLNQVWGSIILLSWGSWPRVRRQAVIPQGPCVWVANHRSYLDIPALHVAIGRQFRMLGKAELGRVPIFGRPYRYLHLTFDRSDARQSARALLQAEDLLRQGISVVIFPEGTTRRSPSEVLGDFKTGAFLLATRSGCPVVPVALRGTSEALSNDGRFWTRPARLDVIVGEPIRPAGQSPAELAQAARQVILQELLSLPSDSSTAA